MPAKKVDQKDDRESPAGEPALVHGAMEEKGAYNRHATIQATGVVSALPLLENAVRNLATHGTDQRHPVVIADYGSSQGKNSLKPMRAAIRILRERFGPNRPIFVYHVDLRINDFNTLFEVLYTDPESYVLGEPNVFPCAIGKTFYENVFPPDHVDLAWSSYAAHWLSRIPAPIPGHLVSFRARGVIRNEFERQAARDWEAFLSVRARELRREGRLIVVLPAMGDDESTYGLEDLMDSATGVLAEMVENGAITADERARMVLGYHVRRRRDLLAPFVQTGRFQHLTVEECQTLSLPDSGWIDYKRHGDKDKLATQHARFFRSAFMPTLALGLTNANDAGRRSAFADQLENGLKRRLTRQPSPMNTSVGIIVLAKES